MDCTRSGARGKKFARLCLGFLSFIFVCGLVSCATERQATAIAAPPTAARSTLSTTAADSISTPDCSTATRITLTASAVASTPTATVAPTVAASATPTLTASPTATRWSTDPHPLQIEVMRKRSYPGSTITIEEILEPEADYNKYVVSYESDGNKIYALMTVPNGAKPDRGWPVIVFNHGYIRPSEYSTTGNYTPYMEMLASNGYIVFKSDYRGHGRSDGEEAAGGGYGMPDYTADVLNAIASLKTYEDADPDRFGMWGHSMGGQITLRAMVVSQDIKAGVIWAGVVPPYPDIIARWDFTRNRDFFAGIAAAEAATPRSSAGNWLHNFSGWVNEFTTTYGNPAENPTFWSTISPNSYLQDLSGPIQLHHSTTDRMVPLSWSETLVEELEAVGDSSYEFYTYPDDNHNIAVSYGIAMQRTVDFFDREVKSMASRPLRRLISWMRREP